MNEIPSLRPVSAAVALPFLLGGLVLAGPAEGKAENAPPSPRPWLEKKVEAARDLAVRKVKEGSPEAKKLEQDARALINEMLDWDEMTRRSLGSEWKKRSKAEQAEFSKLLRDMIEASYESKMRMASRGKAKKPSEVKIIWEDESIRGNKAKIAARVAAEKSKGMIEFSMLFDGKRWKVYDVAIDDVSTVRTYRSQFRKLIKEKGFAALLDRMRAKAKDIKEGRGDLASAMR